MRAASNSVSAPAPCEELHDWYDTRLHPLLVEAVRKGKADAATVAQLERDLRTMIDGASPCRGRVTGDRNHAGSL